MSTNDPGDPGNPLQGLLGDLLKVIGSAPGGGVPWFDAARTLAHGVASDGEQDENPDPLERIHLEELSRVAELHVADATGLPVGRGQGPLTFVPVSRSTWAVRTLDAWRPVLDKLIAAQEQSPPQIPGGERSPDTTGDGLHELLGQFALTMGPVLLGMQFGSAAGHLAQRSLGQYALPLPWPPSDELLIVPRNVAAFAEDWSAKPDETELWVCVRELVTHAVLSRPHVAARVRDLLEAATRDAVALQESITERLGGEDSDPGMLQNLLSDPESLLADLLTPGQRYTSAQLTAITTSIGAYVDHLTSNIAKSLTGSANALTEAWYRYRVADATGEQAAGALFGLDLGRDEVDRGAAFVRGVIERSGEGGLALLWTAERNLPTPADVDAPGLWLERINLPADDELGHGSSEDPGTAGPENPA